MIASGNIKESSSNSIRRISNETLEQTHLKFLKWTLSVHKKTSNLACWGDTGRMPLAITLTKQVKDYFNRLQAMDATNEDTLVRHAFAEQRNLNLPWYNNVTESTVTLSNNEGDTIHSGIEFRKQAESLFHELWADSMSCSSKLKFYASIKDSIGYEPYLSMKNKEKRTLQDHKRFGPLYNF